jgi:hypothetical protein
MSSTAFSKTIAVGRAVLTLVFGCAALPGQQTPAAPSSLGGIEFPVLMQQSVAAGNPVGTKVRAKLAAATLVNGVVIPQEALLSGEVTESVAKSATTASRLAIHMDSAQWKNGSAPINVYLTAWYYPVAMGANQDPAPGLPPISVPHHRAGWHSTGMDTGTPGAVPPAPGSGTSIQRVLMKNVESTRNSDGAVALTSKRFNIKLDKQITYVLAAGGLLPAK